MRLRNLAVGLVSRVPARVQTKLLVAFLAMVALLILLGAVGLQVLSGMNARTEELIELQRKIAAYRQVQHDTTRQLYGVASALLSAGRAGARRHRCASSASSATTSTGCSTWPRARSICWRASRQDYDRFIAIVTGAVELARAGQVAEAREVQLSEARPLADRLERLTNQLVNVAEADMLERIEASQRAYDASRAGRGRLRARQHRPGARPRLRLLVVDRRAAHRDRGAAAPDRGRRVRRARRRRQPRRAGRARRRRQPHLRGAGQPLSSRSRSARRSCARRSSGRPRPARC